MSKLQKQSDPPQARGERFRGRALRELSAHDLERVAGAGCTFSDSMFGQVFHRSYPPEH